MNGSLDTMPVAHPHECGAQVNDYRGTVVFGIVRPCTHRLSDGLKAEWMAHLCGLCLALRSDHGQFARIVTNYDGLIVSVLTESQTGRDPGRRRTAGPCPLRSMRTAPVARGEGARLAAAVSLVLASAKVRDHVADGDGLLKRRPVAAAARRVAAGWDRAGARTGAQLGFDTALLVEAVDRQTGIERLAGPGTPLLTVTEPTETATAAAFAHTAVLAGKPRNAEPLAEAGRLFGRLAHLLDAVEDQEADAASGAWNPLTATGTSRAEALPAVRRRAARRTAGAARRRIHRRQAGARPARARTAPLGGPRVRGRDLLAPGGRAPGGRTRCHRSLRPAARQPVRTGRPRQSLRPAVATARAAARPARADRGLPGVGRTRLHLPDVRRNLRGPVEPAAPRRAVQPVRLQ